MRQRTHLIILVATAPTVYGIETLRIPRYFLRIVAVATAPTVYGIETQYLHHQHNNENILVATAPTVYGIET